MKIAEEISTTIETSVHTVKDSISNYGERIESAVSRLSKSGEQHAMIIEQLGPQIKKVAQVAEESGKLSAEVTRNINEVTVHLQYQDSVRQILEHMVKLVESLTRKGTELAESTGKIGSVDPERISEEVLKLMTGLFTTREEWKAFGYDLDEGVEAKGFQETKSKEEDFEGDVTLF
jgi:gas vesicle protein